MADNGNITVVEVTGRNSIFSLNYQVVIQPTPMRKYLFGIYNVAKKHEVNFGIENIKIPSDIKYTSGELVRFVSSSPALINYKDGDNEITINITIQINCEAIQDVGNIREFDIHFEIIGRDKNKSVVVRQPQTVSIHIHQRKPKIQASMNIDEKVDFEKNAIKKIGELAVFYDKETLSLIKQPNINLEVLLTLKNDKGNSIEGLLWLKDEKTFLEGKYIAEEVAPLSKEEKNGYSQPVRIIPLYVDFSKIQGINKESTPFSIEMEYGRFCIFEDRDCKYNLEIEPEKFIVIKRIIPTTFDLTVQDLSEKPIKVTEKSCVHLNKINFAPNGSFGTPVEIAIQNMASEAIVPRAGLVISDISISESGATDLFLRDKEGRQIKNVIKYDSSLSQTLKNNGPLFIGDGSDEKLSIKMEFNPRNIDYIGVNKFDFEIVSTVDIHYWENKDGLPMSALLENLKTKSFVLVWHLHMLPHSEWLCIDYGSSAIVCKYDTALIDLKSKKDEIIRDDAELSRKYRRDDMEEAGTKFLNSDIILYESIGRNNSGISSLCSEQDNNTLLPYSNQAVFLAPTSSLIRDRYLTQIPCLKVLVGNEVLPKDSQYEMFSYYHKDGNGGIVHEMARDVVNKRQCLLNINSIFAESYHILLRYFISSSIPNVNNINNLALTYPNTYTPYHRSMLSKIVHKVFPHLRNLKFVSESDSVAAFYMSHWTEYHNDITKLKSPEGERVLVYDMGAGTLDITYFSQKWNPIKCSHKLNIECKLGTGKAGNYIDFILARIICRLVGIDPNIANTDIKGEGDMYTQRVLLKQVIKSQIKPALSSYENREISFSLQKVGGLIYTVSTAAILDDKEFIKCLDECTLDVIDKLKKYLSKQRPIIDTVIMSGRSCKLLPLRKKLEEAVKTNSRTKDIDFIVLDEPSNPNPNTKIDSREDRQKTVVVEGAEIIAREFSNENSLVRMVGKRLYASYGVYYKNIEGDMDYTELINHSETEDIPIDYMTPSKQIKISKNSTISLVQSYLDEEETKQSLQGGKMEFVSMMQSFSTLEFTGNEVIVKLKFDMFDNISLILNNSQSDGIPPKGVDLRNPITKKSLWPLVFTA